MEEEDPLREKIKDEEDFDIDHAKIDPIEDQVR